jgi:hypothetical protein
MVLLAAEELEGRTESFDYLVVRNIPGKESSLVLEYFAGLLVARAVP